MCASIARPGALVVGTSFGCLTHVRALRRAGFDVHALVGRDPARTRERAARFDVAHAFTSLDDALELPGVVLVSVATPPASHHELVLRALDAGRHVLCEKPFALDAAQAREMLQRAGDAGVVHAISHEFRFGSAQAHLRRLVASGAIGEPRQGSFVFDHSLVADPASEVPDWWRDGASGGGWLGAYGSHAIDQIRSTLGEFRSVSGQLQVDRERGWSADDGYSVAFELEGGFQGVMEATCRARDVHAVCRVVGSEATASIEGEAVWLADASGRRRLDTPRDLLLPKGEPPPTAGLSSAYELVHATGTELPPSVRQAERIRAAIVGDEPGGDPAVASFRDGLAHMQVLDAIRASASRGERVRVPALEESG